MSKEYFAPISHLQICRAHSESACLKALQSQQYLLEISYLLAVLSEYIAL